MEMKSGLKTSELTSVAEWVASAVVKLEVQGSFPGRAQLRVLKVKNRRHARVT